MDERTKLQQHELEALRRSLAMSETLPRVEIERVLEAFRNDPILSERAVDIGAIGRGIIELTGWVHAEDETQHAVTITRGVPGVDTVVNRLVVRDEGPGIDEEHAGRIFERFYRVDPSRARPGGTGLGLAIVKRIIERHGGRIWAAENAIDGTGSVFGFRIPRLALPIAPSEIAPTGEPPPFVLRRRDPGP